MSKFQQIIKNTKGTDYLITDIHGCFDLVDAELKKVGFDPTKDRLFHLGDLVDRGPQSYLAAEYLEYPWFISLQGNHDAFAYHTARLLLENNQKKLNESIDVGTCIGNGGAWIVQQPDSVLKKIVDNFKRLPMAIEYIDENGKIIAGLIHGEVPQNYNWEQVKEELSMLPDDFVYSLDTEENDEYEQESRVIPTALWGRKKFKARITGDQNKLSTAGVPILICGHNIVFVESKGAIKIGNNRLIDHGINKRGVVHIYTFDEIINQ